MSKRGVGFWLIGGKHGYVKCSECLICFRHASTFCPNCGTKMLEATSQVIPIEVLDQLRREIEKPLNDERSFDTDDAKAQAIALNWCLEKIDNQLDIWRRKNKI